MKKKLLKIKHKLPSRRRLRISDRALKVKEARIVRKISHSRFAGRIKNQESRIKNTGVARKVSHSRFALSLREHKRLSYSFALLLIFIPVFIGLFAYIQNRNNQRFATDVPYQEKIADGAWILHNMDQKPQVLTDGSTGTDLNLKEVVNVGDFVSKTEASELESDIAKPFDALKYRWMVKIFSGTYFEFGAVSSDTPDGKVLPVVRVRNTDGAYVAYAPSGIESGIRNNESSIYVTPKVDGNVISWSMAEGVTARYTILEDRVKADYIIDDKESYAKNRLNFDFEYSGGDLEQGPTGNIFLYKTNFVEGSGDVREIFTIPNPEIKDAADFKFKGSYEFRKNQDGKAEVVIDLPENKLSKAKFPLTVDPIVIDNSVNGGILKYGNARKMVEDAWGNLILVTSGWNFNRDNVWYKNYDSEDWVDAEVTILNSDLGYCRAQRMAIDIDSHGDIQMAGYFQQTEGYCEYSQGQIAGLTFYARLNVVRDASNRVTQVNVSDYQEIDLSKDNSGGGYNSRPSVIVANKGAGLGKEKVVVTYTTADPQTDRTETRIMQKDVWNVGYEDMILSDSSLVGYWRLGERMASDSAKDSSLTRNNGSTTYFGTPDTQASPAAILGDSENTAWYFDSADSEKVRIADNDAYSPVTTGQLTVEVWAKPTGAEDAGFVVSKGNTSNFEWDIQRYNSGGNTGYQAYIRALDGTSIAQANVIDSGLASDDQWHYIVLTIDTSAEEAYLYVNNQYSALDDTWATTMGNGSSELEIAGRRDYSASNYFKGAVDELAIYSDILTASEMTEHYQKAKESYYSNVIKATSGLSGYWRLGTQSGTIAYDESGNGNHGTYNSVTLGVAGATGSDWDTATTFSGATDSQVLISDDAAMDFDTGDYTLEAWIKRSSTPATDEFIMGHGGGGGVNEWDFYQATGTNTLYTRISSTAYTSGTENISDGRWHHVVFSADRDGNGTWYKDGKVSAVYDISGTSTQTMTSSNNMFIGDRFTAGKEWIGSIDEVAIYKGVALSASQVMEHYQAANDWKNISEERNSNAAAVENCNEDVTRGEAGFATDTYCAGVTDILFSHGGYYSWSLAEVNHFPGTPPRTPDSVKFDDNGSLSDLNSTIDGDRGSTNEINSFTTTDYLYIGDIKPFSKVTMDMFATNSATADFATTDVEYCSLSYDGVTCDSWTDLSNFYDYTDNATSTFSEDGSLLFDEPDNWVTVTVDSTTDKYWVRFRPDAAMDSDVSIAEVTVNDRNSNALIVFGGSNVIAGLQPSMVPWDDITNEGWENRADNPGNPWYQYGYVAGGFGWDPITIADPSRTVSLGYCDQGVLSTTMDYINNQFYAFFRYDPGSCSETEEYAYVYTIGNNKDVLDINNWTNTHFPIRGADPLGFNGISDSLSFDGENVWLLVNPDIEQYGTSTQSAYFMRCTPYKSGDPDICDSGQDWGGYQKAALKNDLWADQGSAPEAVKLYAKKIDNDTTEINYFFSGQGNGNLLYDRIYVDLEDRKVIGAASGDDGWHRDCDTGTDDQDISSIVTKLGREATDASCDSSDNSENHSGFRFQGVDVAPGAKISSAYIDFKVASRSGSTAMDFDIYGEDADSSSAYSAQTNCTAPCSGNVGERTLTTSKYSHSIDFSNSGDAATGMSADQQGVTYRFDVTDLVQEIVCRGVIETQPCVGDFNGSGAWASGNDLSIILKSAIGGGTDNYINIFSYDDTQGLLEPTLQINCADSCDEPKPQEAEWCDLGTGSNGSNDCDNNWQSRKKITFDNRASTENLTDFPTLLRLDSTKIDYSKVQNAGQDLRFVDATGGAVLRYDIDEWDENGESLVWVRVPQIDAESNTDYIYMYYNNASASAGMNEEETYEENIELVAHLHEDPTSTCNSSADEICDSSQNNYHMDSGDTWTSGDSVNGAIGSAIDFDGAGQDFQRATTDDKTALPSGNSARTLEAWFRTTVATTSKAGIIGYGDQDTGTGPEDHSIMVYDGRFETEFRLDNSGTSFSELDDYNDGEWHHGVVTYDGSVASGYIDGLKVGDDFTPASTPDTKNDSTAFIGIGVWNAFWEGSIDETRIHTGARSADYIEASYLTQRPGSTFASIGSEESDPTTSDYEALIKADPDLVGYWRLGEPANYTEFVQSLNPNGYWPMDDASGDFRDASGNGYTASSNGTPGYQQTGPTINGQVQSAALFDEDKSPTQYATFSNTIDDNVTSSTGMTISAWFKIPPSGGTTDPIVSQADTNNTSWVVTTTSGGGITFYIKEANGTNDCWAGQSGSYDDDEWHHFVGWVDSSGDVHAIVDGGSIITNSCGTPAYTWNAETDSYGAIGAFNSSGATPSDVSVSHVAYWDHDIGDAQQAGLYNAKTAFDESSTANHGAYQGTPQLGVSGAILGDKDTAVTLNGSTDYVSVSDNSAYDFGTGDYSLEFWVKRSTLPTDSEFILGHGGNGNTGEWDLYWQDSTDELLSRIWDGVSSFVTVTSGTEDISDGGWHHIVLTMDRDGNGTFYKDGQVSGTPTDISSLSAQNLTTSDTLWIGRRNSTTCGVDDCYYNGSLDDVAIYKGRVLSAEDVLSHYNTGIASKYQQTILDTTGLVGYWRLGEGGGTTAYDISDTGNDGTYNGSPTLGVSGGIKGDNDTAVDFDETGLNQYVSISDNNAYSLSTTNKLTVEAWINADSAADYQDNIVAKGTTSNYEWEISWATTNEIYAALYESSGTGRAFCDGGTVGLDADEWGHVVLTLDDDTDELTVYVNGEVSCTDNTWTGSSSNGSSAVNIGRRPDNNHYYDGTIDDVAIYNTVLSDNVIKEHYLAGGGTNRFNTRQFSKGVTTATGSASFSDLDGRFSSADYVAASGDDETYVDVSGDINISGDTDANPAFMLKVNNAKNKNTDRINATAVVKSSVPASTNPIYLQVYGGNDWVTIASDNTSKADTDITLTGAISSSTSDYYYNETSGVGTVGDICTDGTSNCWTYFRIYQDTVDDSYNTVLSLDAFNEEFDSVPSQMVFTNAWRYIPTNTCSGSSGAFTLQMQDESGTAAPPTQLTTVRVTSNSGGTVTLYSDSACINPITNGDLFFTTSDTSKTFYLKDTGISNEYTLTATVQSGDVISAGTGFYTIEGGLRLDSRTRIKGGGDTRIRGGTRFQ